MYSFGLRPFNSFYYKFLFYLYLSFEPSTRVPFFLSHNRTTRLRNGMHEHHHSYTNYKTASNMKCIKQTMFSIFNSSIEF